MEYVLEALSLYSILFAGLVALIIWWRLPNETEPKKKKRKRSQNPQDVWLQTVLFDCLIYGIPQTLFIYDGFYKALDNPKIINQILHEEPGLFKTKYDYVTLSIVYTNGIRKDYTYKGGKK